MAVPYFGGAIATVADTDIITNETRFAFEGDEGTSSRFQNNIDDSPTNSLVKRHMIATNTYSTDKLVFNIEKIIIAAVVFFAIITWFEFLRTVYDAVFILTDHHPDIIIKRFVYAIFITAIAIVMVYIVYSLMIH